MNKLIRKFEQESGLEIYGLGAKRVRWEQTMEKFTLLVVRECIDTLHQHGWTDAADDMKKHFGVEE